MEIHLILINWKTSIIKNNIIPHIHLEVQCNFYENWQINPKTYIAFQWTLKSQNNHEKRRLKLNDLFVFISKPNS
jgi:hypothetical protein